MKFSAARARFPAPVNLFLAIASAVLLILSFPDFDFWFLAWLAPAPLLFAVAREKQSAVKSFVLGWAFGISFFFGSCWWLTYAPTTYGGIPAVVSYALLFIVTLVAGLFPAIFAAIFSLLLKCFGSRAFFAAPFLWTATEFLRFNLTGNNWNAIGYSQAFEFSLIQAAQFGGVYIVGFLIVAVSAAFNFILVHKRARISLVGLAVIFFVGLCLCASLYKVEFGQRFWDSMPDNFQTIVAVQPDVPMSDLKYGDWEKLRARHVELAEDALRKFREQSSYNRDESATVIFPESPMNFEYESDRELKSFLRDFAARNNASVLFNSAQPNTKGTNLFNSAVMINKRGEKIGQYDKIHLVPFGETVPLPDTLAQFVPTMVGSFETGANYNLFPVGSLKGGVMICFESHFASLSREYAREGADVLIEMTNDGYLGKTPILRQHLANAVFRAVETNREVVRVTNVGITADISPRGRILDATESYEPNTRVWRVVGSRGTRTFYVEYGDLFAWLCSIASLALLFFSFRKQRTTKIQRWN